MLPIASDLANRAVHTLARSALPDAPVMPVTPARDRRLRAACAAILRRSAERRNRLAQRLDPVCGATVWRPR